MSQAVKEWDQDSIKDLRQRLRLTQEELAASLGCSLGPVSRWETGRSSPSLRFIRKLDELASGAGSSTGRS